MPEPVTSRRRLGRGLEALLGPTREEAQREGSLVELAIAVIRPNPYQPRRDVDPAQLDELTASIRKAGLLQPVVVRSEEHTSELQSQSNLVCRLLLEKKEMISAAVRTRRNPSHPHWAAVYHAARAAR